MSGRTTPSGIRPPSGLGLSGYPSNSSLSHQLSTPASPAPAQHVNISHHTPSTSVQVALRIRPPSKPEAGSTIPPRFQRSVVHQNNGSSTQLTVEASPVGGKGPAKQHFSFDRVLGPDDGQSSVYDVVEPLVSRFLEGYNVTVLAYGQTSSGKSYTMGTDTTSASSSSSSAHSSPLFSSSSSASPHLGEDNSRSGIIPRAIKQVFDEITRRTRSETGKIRFETRNSYVEIYNEELIDLLAGDISPDERTPVTIREDKAGHIIWSGLRELKVKNSVDVMRNLEAGSAIRQTGSTAMNDQSSRSHAIFSLTLTQRKYTGQGSPPLSQARSTDSSPSIPQSSSSFQTPIASRRTSSAIPGRVSSPTPTTSNGMGSPRPSTPGGGNRGYLPRPSSSLGMTAAGGPAARDPRAPSPAGTASGRDDDHASSNQAGTNENEWTTVTSKFHFVDLAGSERLKRTSAVGDRAKEGISINGGLLALGNVISALGDPAKARQTTHIPYRDSKLTRLLQDSLGGNAHTLMIACISPVEYNLSETLNTLKYANRARNIKNRAELNEIEAGWDDVDHLQQLVARLRNELGTLRGGNGSMPAITEEAGLPSRFAGSVSTSANRLHLQDQYTDLSTRYAKLTAELAKAQAAASSPSMLSSDSFAKAVEPVVEEYEKSISALESQLSLTKAALSHSEEVMRETEEKINSDAQVLESNNNIINELKIRVGKLSEREAVTEGYIRDLESRLKSSTEQDEASANLISDLRKEIAKYREVESNTEKYIKDLEVRLLKSEEAKHMQKNQIESLERDVQRREQAYEELENRLSLLDTTEQHKQLLLELDERDRRILVIQKELEEAKLQMLALEQDSENMKITASEDAKQKAGLHRRIESLEKQPKIAITASSNGSENALSAPSSAEALSRSLTPPQTPLHEDGAEDQNLVDSPDAKLSQLEKRHEAALRELDTLSSKYKESLKQIEDLQQHAPGVRYRKSAHSSDEIASSSPEEQMETLDDVPEELRDIARKSSLSPSANGSYSTPTRTSRTANPASRRSMPLSPRGSFLGRSPVATHSASHLRSASASLSQESSLAQYLNGNLPSSAAHHISGFGQSSAAAAAAPSLQMVLGNGTMSPRSSSPLLNRRESLLNNGEMFFASPPQLRSNDSLQQEVRKLQETLNEREEEIRALEASITEMRKLGAKDEAGPTRPLMIQPPRIFADDSLKTPVGTAPPDLYALSPNTIEAFNAIKKNIDSTNEMQVDETSEDQLARLNDLMLSMAKKEVAHQEKVEELEEQLSSLRKQHEELRTLSKDQVHNMSTEISALREQLSSSGAETKAWEERLAKMDTEIKAKNEEMDRLLHTTEETQAQALNTLREEHELALTQRDQMHDEGLRQIQEEHASLLQRMLEAKEALFIRKAQEHEQALEDLRKEHKASSSKREAEQQDSWAAESRSQLEEALRRKEIEHGEIVARLELQASHDTDQTTLLAKLNAQHKEALQLRSQFHEEVLQKLKAEHATAQQEHASSLRSLKEEHETAVAHIAEQHAAELRALRDEHQEAMAHAQSQKEIEVTAIVKQHKDVVDAALSDMEEKIQALQAQHAQSLLDLEVKHLEAQQILEKALEEAGEQQRQALGVAKESWQAEEDKVIAVLQDVHAQALARSTEDNKAALDFLRKEHEESKAKLTAEHTANVETLRQNFEALLSETKSSGELRLLDKLAKAAADHADVIQHLKQEHDSAVSALKKAHDESLASAHDAFDTKTNEAHKAHMLAGQEVDNSHNEQLHQLQAKLQQTEDTHRALSAENDRLQELVRHQTAKLAEHIRSTDQLRSSASAQTAQLRGENEGLQRSLKEAKDGEASLGSELQEALAALGTLEKALIESQDERERMMGELSDLQKKEKTRSANDVAAQREEELSAQLASVIAEKDALKAEISKITHLNASVHGRRAMSPPPSSALPPTPQGLGILNGFGGHRGSKDQETLLTIDTGLHSIGSEGVTSPVPSTLASTSIGPLSPAPSAFPATPSARHTSVLNLVNGSQSQLSRPPPTPPPSMPPPPLPTEAPHSINPFAPISNSSTNAGYPSSAAGPSGSNNATGSSTSLSNHGRESVSSVFTRDSHNMDTLTSSSNRTNSMSTMGGAGNADTISVDPRVAQKIDEQDAAITRLTKRLEHAETELKANIDLVTTLESALNDSERNLRKSRIQMNELAKERESATNQNEALRDEVVNSHKELERMRSMMEKMEEETRRRLEQQRKTQSEAQRNAEARMAELQKLNRKSKFNCF